MSAKPIEPLFSVISAVYNVAEYLPAFLEAYQAQTLNHELFELILVSDGSPDESERLIADFASQSDIVVRLIRKDNGGQASARNVGLRHATGKWVTFTDPDDWVNPDYLSATAQLLDAEGYAEADIFVATMVRYLEEKDTFDNKHPLAYRFAKKDQLVSLERSPRFFHMHAASAFFDRARIDQLELTFDESLPVFEDAKFVAEYLLSSPDPHVAFVHSAEYYYRVRAAGDSSVQTSSVRPEKYTTVPQHGHVALVDKSLAKYGAVPGWLQFMLMYDLFWYYRAENSAVKPSAWLTSEQCADFNEAVAHVLGNVSVANFLQAKVPHLPAKIKSGLLSTFLAPQALPAVLTLQRIDEERGAALLRGFSVNAAPDIVVSRNGVTHRATNVAAVPIIAYGRTLGYQLSVWIPLMATGTVLLDGRLCSVERHADRVPGDFSSAYLKQVARPGVPGRRAPRVRREGQPSLFGKVMKRLSRKRETSVTITDDDLRDLRRNVLAPAVHDRYRNCWILMDRVDAANDNAEHLYRYLMAKQPSVNAFFVLDRASRDWGRLRQDGFRLVEHGSREHLIALCHADILASSHVDKFITDPLPDGYRAFKRWKFVFLQHGVTKDNLSRWFNSKRLDLLVAATTDEYNYFTGLNSPFDTTPFDVKLTGFPRYDALADTSKSDAWRVIVAPTWRKNLARPKAEGVGWEASPELGESTYYRQFSDMMGCLLEELRARPEVRVAFLPHPSMQGFGDLIADEYPDVEILSFNDGPFADLVKSARVWVTDFSSTAFDAAFARVPVVYLQDPDEDVFGGAVHFYEKGYFDYSADGFGPLVATGQDAADMVSRILSQGPVAEYEERVERAFGSNDGANSERVFLAASELLRPASYRDLLSPESATSGVGLKPQP